MSEEEKYKLVREYFSSGANMDSKTAIPNAAAFAAAEYLLDWIGDEYGAQYRESLNRLLTRFKVLSPSEKGKARDQVERILKGLQKEDEDRGKSLLDRLNQK